MGSTREAVSTVAALTMLVAACSSSKQASDATVAPSAPLTMSAFAGTWTTGPAESGAAPGTCTGVEYTITRMSDTSAGVTYAGTCAGVSISGTGKGTLAGVILNWEASGSATRGSLTCPFQFTNSTATSQGDGILVTYGGTVCGVPVQGSQLLRRR